MKKNTLAALADCMELEDLQVNFQFLHDLGCDGASPTAAMWQKLTTQLDKAIAVVT